MALYIGQFSENLNAYNFVEFSYFLKKFIASCQVHIILLEY